MLRQKPWRSITWSWEECSLFQPMVRSATVACLVEGTSWTSESLVTIYCWYCLGRTIKKPESMENHKNLLLPIFLQSSISIGFQLQQLLPFQLWLQIRGKDVCHHVSRLCEPCLKFLMRIIASTAICPIGAVCLQIHHNHCATTIIKKSKLPSLSP